MNKKTILRSLSLSVLALSLGVATQAHADQAPTAPQPVRDWTFMVFMNGHNNLDQYTTLNLNQMEQVGSTDRVNVIAQWASASTNDVKRVFVKKDSDMTNVTSPVIQTLQGTDMGDYKELENFVEWGAQNYPAKHYFVAVWDHGSGWHTTDLFGRGGMHPMNISFDDNSGNSITTVELGQAMADVSKKIGQKIDVYGSDACLMSMVEIAYEMKDSVNYFVGSEETEPLAGWPYDQLLTKWNALPATASAGDVAKLLPPLYTASYQAGGENPASEVTMATLDMSKIADLAASLKALKTDLTDTHGPTDLASTISSTQSFELSDYVDLGDFAVNLQSRTTIGSLPGVKTALANAVMVNATTANYKKAQGIAIWVPADSSGYSQYSTDYKALAFDKDTGWSAVLEKFAK